MEKTKLLLFITLSATLFLPACSKSSNSYFGRPMNISSSTTDTSSNSQYIFFFNIVIDSNSSYTFELPQLTAGALDSGTFRITFKSNLVVENAWYSLPEFIFTDGATVFVYELNVQPGAVTLMNYVKTTPEMNYCFYISTSH
jgi:hypothetical protein